MEMQIPNPLGKDNGNKKQLNITVCPFDVHTSKMQLIFKKGEHHMNTMFILCTQIMTYMILQNNEIKGLIISDHEI